MYWPGQVLYTSIVLVPLWVRGAAWSLRSARFRPAGIAVVTVICLQFVLGGKTYYPGGGYTFLFAAGAAALSAAAPGLLPLRRRAAVYCLAAAVCSVISLPLLPAAALARFPVQKVNYDLGEEIGWPSRGAVAGPGLPVAPAYRTVAGDPARRQLRRGRRGRPLRAGPGPAGGLQRREQLLALGAAPGRRHHGRRDRRQPGPAAP